MTEISPANDKLEVIKETTVFYRKKREERKPYNQDKKPQTNIHHDASICCLYTSLGILIFHQ